MGNWSIDDIPDLTGRVFVVTGANSGIGFEAARLLAEKGATTVLAGRNEDKVARAKTRILATAPRATLGSVRLDLASLASVREAAAELSERGVDVLVNNAGLMAIPRRETEDGFEMQLGVNHLGHFALTALLWPKIRERVVTVTSLVHRLGRVDFDDLMGERRYRKWPAYFQSKLANVLFALELSRRAEAAGSPVRSMLCHPGYASTNLQSKGAEMEKNPLVGGIMGFGNATFAQSAEAGAWPTVVAAVADLPSGSFTGPAHLGWRGRPRLVSSSRAGRDEAVAKRLWEVSEELTGIRFDVS
jgi:NAD(P)-dependent dehydrogenase (short-subunit alcohol dehydrogenase family)